MGSNQSGSPRKVVISSLPKPLKKACRMLVGSLALFACPGFVTLSLPSCQLKTHNDSDLSSHLSIVLTLDWEILHHWWSHFSHFLRFAEQLYTSIGNLYIRQPKIREVQKPDLHSKQNQSQRNRLGVLTKNRQPESIFGEWKRLLCWVLTEKYK